MPSLIQLAAALVAPSLALAGTIQVQARDTLTQTCSKPGVPFNYVGCYIDPSSPRALAYDTQLPRDGMTIEKCTAACRQAGYRYAGLEYYFQCFCGASVTGPGLADDQTECSYACTGDSTETCGGFDRLSIYEDPNFAPVDDTTIADYQSQGCYTDEDSNGRALAFRQDQVDTSTATTEICLQACKKGGYSHAGLEYFGECYCGVVLANSSIPAPDSDCNTPCNGNNDETCGGPSRINLYVAKDLEAAPECPPEEPPTPMPSTSTTSTYPTATTTKPPTTPTTSSTMTTTTSAGPSKCTNNAPAPTCEYGCGKWCSKPIPWWSGSKNGPAKAFCQLQVASCFATAGWPASLKCWSFMEWCSKIPQHADKATFLNKCPPQNPPPSYPGACTPTSTTATPATSTSVVPPVATGMCVLPNGPRGSGYEAGNCVGGIKPPFVTCNDVYSDWRQNPFKLYSDRNSANCPSYGRNNVPDACKAACKVQYNACVGTYAEGCRNQRSGPSYNQATQQCKNQYYDCLNVNGRASPGNRCSSWNGGWN